MHGYRPRSGLLLLDSNTFLGFCGMVYRQTFGTAMGSPVSVTVANLVMEDVEQGALAMTDVHPRFWKRYVDDTCTVLRIPADDVQRFLDHLNGVEPSIRFTVVESDGKLPFLDVLLRHNPDGSVSTTVTGGLHTLIGTWTLHPTTPLPTKSSLSERYTAESRDHQLVCGRQG